MKLPAKHSSGYSLPELLVAMAVLCLLLVLIFQVIEQVLNVTGSQEDKIEATASGRRLLDVMSVDIENAVIGPDSTVIAPTSASSNVILAMLCNRRAPSSAAVSRFLAVKYTLDSSNRVYRSYGSVGFSRTNLMDASLNASTNPAANAAIPLATGILAVQARAFTATTNYPVFSTVSSNWAVTNRYRGYAVPAGYNALVTASSGYGASLANCTRSLEISVAAVDAENYALIRSTGYLPSVKSALAGDPIGWKVAVDTISMPSRIKSAIRILQKTTPLP